MELSRILTGVFGVAFFCGLAHAEIALPQVFSTHMVLQRDRPVPVWGMSLPDDRITVTFGGQVVSGNADQHGQWRILIGPFQANSTSQKMVISSSDKNTASLTIEDILVGEVWVGSGQSNMKTGAESYTSSTQPAEISKPTGDTKLHEIVYGGPYPEIRIITSGGAWQLSTPQNLAYFSAEMQSFGIPLHNAIKVPVGLMTAAVSGTPSVRWLTSDAIKNDVACQAAIAKANEAFPAEQQKFADLLKQYEADLAKWNLLPEDQKKGKKAPEKPRPPKKPGEAYTHIGDLHDSVLKPFIGYGIRAVLWDQGEGGTALQGVDQYTLMGALIRSWRQEWGQGTFPFLYVQKPSGGGCAFDYKDRTFSWGSLRFDENLPKIVPDDGDGRETYIRIASYPSTFMIPTSDLGTGNHPVNKSGYGARATRVALGAVYGHRVEIGGPTFMCQEIEGSEIRIRFDHVGKGLTYRNGEKLQGFAIAGADKKYVWASATVDGQCVVAFSPDVPDPKYVRYAWSQQHPWANLFNLDSLPAVPFSTEPRK